MIKQLQEIEQTTKVLFYRSEFNLCSLNSAIFLSRRDILLLLTGGGIGRSIEIALAKEGSRVVVTDIDQAGIERTLNEIPRVNGKALGINADTTDLRQIGRLVEDTVKAFGNVDILVNVAGGDLGTPTRIEDVSEKDFDTVFNVNIKALFFLCKAALRYMKEQKNGKIINISSHSGRYFGWLAGAHYAASKAAVLGLTRQLAKEVGKYGICVNAIAPGITISSPKLDKQFHSLPQENQKAIIDFIALGRLGLPEDHARVVVFLASEDSQYITGPTIDVNGGEFMI